MSGSPVAASVTTPLISHGMLVLTVQSTEKAGKMTVSVVCPASERKVDGEMVAIPEIRRSISIQTR